jgi:hypothetical protein
MITTFGRRAIGSFAMLLCAGSVSCGASAPPAAAQCGGDYGTTTIIDDPYAYGGAGVGWYDPGDSYPPFVDDSGDDTGYAAGDDSNGDSTGSGDDSSASGDDSSGSSGDDSSSSDSMRVRPHVAHARPTGSVRTTSMPLGAPGCSTCTVVCTLDPATVGAPPGASATESSADPQTDACALAQHDVATWSHRTFGARVLACNVVASAP